MKRKGVRRVYITIIFISILLLLPVNARLKTIRSSAPKTLLYIPSGKYLKVVTLGYENLLADLIYIWSIQYYADRRLVSRYCYLEHIYSIITDLDPAYIDAYLIGALIMAQEGEDIETAMRILDKGIAANPDKWILAVNAGYYAWLDLHDYERASGYFKKASEIDGVPPAVKRLFAAMLAKSGDTESSLSFWREIYETSEDKDSRRIAEQHIYKLRVGLDIAYLTETIRQYRVKCGKSPLSWEQMVQAGLLSSIPLNPNGNPYLYSPATGQVENPHGNLF